MTDIRALGYIVVTATDLEKWRSYGEQVVGMMAEPAPGGGLYLKMDERPFRWLIQPGEADGYFASGWELPDPEAFEEALAALRGRDVKLTEATGNELADRKVARMVWCHDPSGNRHELYWGPKSDFRRLVSPVGVPNFVTDPMGMGHVVLPAPEFDATWSFLHDLLGFRLSDIYRVKFTDDPEEPVKRIHFTHCNNGRHHSLAIFEMSVPSGCVHAMAEVDTMDEVGRALDRMHAHEGVQLTATLGRHCNDRMISFYMSTPGGFDLEFGYGGRVVDWSRHTVDEFTEVSLWGHDFTIAHG